MLLGGLAIASPIIIHLLNKRRFKVVQWAAMDFLFEADKKNRRRVQLENFILISNGKGYQQRRCLLANKYFFNVLKNVHYWTLDFSRAGSYEISLV